MWNGQALVYFYARETKAEADLAKALTFDEARRIAVNVAKLPAPAHREARAYSISALMAGTLSLAVAYSLGLLFRYLGA
jgi:hypothetical protein